MPHRSLQACRVCGKATRGPYCEAHAHGAADVSKERIRAQQVAGIRKLYKARYWSDHVAPAILMRDPVCKIAVICGGHARSTEVDHVTPAEIYIEQHGGDVRFFYDASNLQGTCKADHSRKTALERRGRNARAALAG